MYTLHVVASERRLTQITLPGSSKPLDGSLENDSVISDDSDSELLGLDLDDDSQAIEFTAGNPRVEHITGVVHLYRPTPGRLPQNVLAPGPPGTAGASHPSSGSGKASTGSGLLAPTAPALPSKGAASWASLFTQLPEAAGAVPQTPARAADTGSHPPTAASPAAAAASERCDELCCLALPSDMTIADFCTFLGAHLLRMRRMRVLRRQVGAPPHHIAATTAAAAAATAVPLMAATAAHAAATTSSGSSSGGGGGGAAGPAAVAAALGAQSAAAGSSQQSSRPSSRGGAASDAAASVGPSSRPATGDAESAAVHIRGMTAGSDAQGPSSPTAASPVHPSQPQAQQGQGQSTGHPHPHPHPRQPTPADRLAVLAAGPAPAAPPLSSRSPATPAAAGAMSHAAAAAAAAAVPHAAVARSSAPRPPSQRVVCMVVMRMESPEAADELFTDLNGKPFSSLEPDIVCRLVHVRHVEVTSGSGRPLGAAAGAADAAAAADALPPPPPTLPPAQSPGQPPPPPPPPGQTELPTCPVCLERLDEYISGIVTTVCNHMFHSECLQKWADTTCPVCRYCVQGAATASRCGVCATAVDLWICLICGHVGCGRYRAGHAADHWRTSGHCYALELETQRVWDYVGDNYVHRLIQSKTDGKLVELAAPAPAAPLHAGGRGGGGGGGQTRGGAYTHHPHTHHGGASCGAAAGGAGGRGGLHGAGGPHGRGGTADGQPGGGGWGAADEGAGGSSGWQAGYGDEAGWSAADEELKEALMASKLDAIAAEYNHLLASQLDSQRQYFEGLLAQATLDADHRCAQAGAATDKARQEAEQAQASAREEARRRVATERKAVETTEALRAVRQEAEFLRSLNETLLANQKDFKQQLAAERSRTEAAEAAVKELQEQVRDLAFFIEAQRTISDAGGGELQNGTVLPLPQQQQASGANRAGRSGGSGAGGRPGTRAAGAGGSRSSAK